MPDCFDEMLAEHNLEDVVDNAFIDSILCGNIGQGSSHNKKSIAHSGVANTNYESENHTAQLAKQEQLPTIMHLRESLPLTVLGRGGEPVVIEDPVQFRNDLTTMVMAQMTAGYVDEEKFEEIVHTGSMIEIATIKMMRKACEGELPAYNAMMDRVLGKSVQNTKNVSVTMTYEDVINKLDPDEDVRPTRVIDATFVEGY